MMIGRMLVECWLDGRIERQVLLFIGFIVHKEGYKEERETVGYQMDFLPLERHYSHLALGGMGVVWVVVGEGEIFFLRFFRTINHNRPLALFSKILFFCHSPFLFQD